MFFLGNLAFWTSFTQTNVDKIFFFTYKVFVHNRVPSNNYITEDLGHSWGTPLKHCLGALFYKGLIRHPFFWGNLAFSRLCYGYGCLK